MTKTLKFRDIVYLPKLDLPASRYLKGPLASTKQQQDGAQRHHVEGDRGKQNHQKAEIARCVGPKEALPEARKQRPNHLDGARAENPTSESQPNRSDKLEGKPHH